MKPSHVVIQLRELGSEFLRKYPQVDVDRQPAGLDFYSLDWTSDRPGAVVFEGRELSVNIPDVLGLQSDQASDGPEKAEGFQEWMVMSRLGDAEDILHAAARQRILGLLDRLLQLGWQPILARSAPRLSGRDRRRYVLSVTNTIGLDARDQMPLDEWMRIPDRTAWPLFAKGIYMELSFVRDSARMALDGMGSYLLTWTFKTDTEYFREYAPPADRDRWRALLPGALRDASARRVAAEAAAAAQGYSMDASYQDPPVPAV